MATTLSLNSTDTIMVTTYWGGVDRGRCYTFHVKSGDIKFTMDGNEAELVEALMNYYEIKVEPASMMPDPDNRGALIPETDPELEKLLDEEEEIARRTVSSPNPTSYGHELTEQDLGRRVQLVSQLGSDAMVLDEGIIGMAYDAFILNRDDSRRGWLPIRPEALIRFV